MLQKFLIPVPVVSLVLFCCGKPIPSEQLNGFYINTKETRKMEIRQQDERFYGIITWIQDPNDQVKPGDTVLRNLEHKRNKWKGEACFGTSSYNCTVTMPDSRTLRISAMGQAKEWKKY